MDFAVLPYGDRAVLVELGAAAVVIPFRDAVVSQAHPAILAVAPAARTVLIEYDPACLDRTALTALLQEWALPASASTPPAADLIELPVRYDGMDLEAVASQTQLSVAAVIDRHLAVVYTVQFCGFSPGFGYLTGLDPVLRLPRLTSPRTEVPAGSVAIAGEFTGVYPRSSPGGWRLLGRTDTTLFDLSRTPPALLTPGSRVRFVRR